MHICTAFNSFQYPLKTITNGENRYKQKHSYLTIWIKTPKKCFKDISQIAAVRSILPWWTRSSQMKDCGILWELTNSPTRLAWTNLTSLSCRALKILMRDPFVCQADTPPPRTMSPALHTFCSRYKQAPISQPSDHKSVFFNILERKVFVYKLHQRRVHHTMDKNINELS